MQSIKGYPHVFTSNILPAHPNRLGVRPQPIFTRKWLTSLGILENLCTSLDYKLAQGKTSCRDQGEQTSLNVLHIKEIPKCRSLELLLIGYYLNVVCS